jgi:hypothetical protein
MRLILPGIGADFTVIPVPWAAAAPAADAVSAAAPAAASAAEVAVDEAFGKPFSQLPQEAQQVLLAKLPSFAGGLAVGPEPIEDYAPPFLKGASRYVGRRPGDASGFNALSI